SLPRSTLFPYTTLFRSVGVVELHPVVEPVHEGGDAQLPRPPHVSQHPDLVLGMAAMPLEVLGEQSWLRQSVVVREQNDRGLRGRSEEHTSELQSLAYLV